MNHWRSLCLEPTKKQIWPDGDEDVMRMVVKVTGALMAYWALTHAVALTNILLPSLHSVLTTRNYHIA